MKVNTKQRKKATRGFEHIYGKDELANRMFHILSAGKQGIDALLQELGIMMAQAIMDVEREELSGPEYFPRQRGVYKWAYQPGSIYLGDQKVSVRHPRLRGPEGEISLMSYGNIEGTGRVLGGAVEQSAPGHFSPEVPGNRV